MPIVVVGKVPEIPKPRTRREVAQVLSILQAAEALLIHANRDHCLPHLIESSVVIEVHKPVLPRRVDYHRHVLMPAARMDARALDRKRADDA